MVFYHFIFFSWIEEFLGIKTNNILDNKLKKVYYYFLIFIETKKVFIKYEYNVYPSNTYLFF